MEPLLGVIPEQGFDTKEQGKGAGSRKMIILEQGAPKIKKEQGKGWKGAMGKELKGVGSMEPP